MRRVLAVMVVLALSACTTNTSGSPIARTPSVSPPSANGTTTVDGITVTLPRGWTMADKVLTPNLGDPHEILSAGTFILSPNHGSECAQYPVTATEAMGAGDAFVTIGERSQGTGGHDPRLARSPTFTLPSRSSNDEWPQCLSKPRDFYHWVTVFEDNGRQIYLYVAMGSSASDEIKGQLIDLLNGIVVGESTGWPMWPTRYTNEALGISFRYPLSCCTVHWEGDPTFAYGQDLASWTSERHAPKRCPMMAPGEFTVLLGEYRQIPGEPLYADDYPPRPDNFDLPPPRTRSIREGCAAQPASLVRFADNDRYLYVLVLWGEGSYDKDRLRVEALLDSLAIARGKPDA